MILQPTQQQFYWNKILYFCPAESQLSFLYGLHFIVILHN